jgi:transglutaminase-like putative cysteine protease
MFSINPMAGEPLDPHVERLSAGVKASRGIAGGLFGSAYRGACVKDDGGQRWLANTPLLEHDHPKIRIQAARLTQLKSTPREKALACFHHVRSMPFALAADGASTSATQVLRDGQGDGHTKGTLMVAMLRSLEIPARLRFVTVRPAFMRGVLDTEGHSVEHAFAEVLLEGEWLGVDTYVVDVKLALAARARLAREGQRAGYAVHAAGRFDWDGRSSAFGQFSAGDEGSEPTHDWGAFDDPQQFHASVALRVNPNWATRAKWAVGAALANSRLREVRQAYLAAGVGKPATAAR